MKKLLIVSALLVPAQTFSGNQTTGNWISGMDMFVGGGLGLLTSTVFGFNDFEEKALFIAGGTACWALNRNLGGEYKSVAPGAAIGGLAGVAIAKLTEQNRLNFAVYGGLLGGLGFYAFSVKQRNGQLEEERSELIKEMQAIKEKFGGIESNMVTKKEAEEIQNTLNTHTKSLSTLKDTLNQVQTDMATRTQVEEVKIRQDKIVDEAQKMATTLNTMNNKLDDMATRNEILAAIKGLAQQQNQQPNQIVRSESAANLNSSNSENGAAENIFSEITSTPNKTPDRSLNNSSWININSADLTDEKLLKPGLSILNSLKLNRSSNSDLFTRSQIRN